MTTKNLKISRLFFLGLTLTASVMATAGCMGKNGFLGQDKKSGKAEAISATSPLASSAATVAHNKQILIGACGAGANSSVRVQRSDASEGINIGEAFVGFQGGVNVGSVDYNADGIPDILVGAAPSAQPHIRVFDGRDGVGEMASYFGFDQPYKGGVNVAGCVLDGKPAIVAGAATEPHVMVFKIIDGKPEEHLSFYAFKNTDGSPVSGIGARVTCGDFNGDGKNDIIVGSGPGKNLNGTVKVFDSANGDLIAEFTPTTDPWYNGLFLAAGNIDGVVGDEIVIGVGAGGTPAVKVIKFHAGSPNPDTINSFLAFDEAFKGGVSVGTTDFDNDGKDDIIVSAGAGGMSAVKIFPSIANAIEKSYTGFENYNGATCVSGI